MSRDPDRLDVYCLDVGQGDCTMILPPSGEGDPVLFDCADSYVAQRFVENHSIGRLAAVVASHLDRDHIGGMLPFLRGHLAAGRAIGKLVIGRDRQQSGACATELIEAAMEWERCPPCSPFELLPPFRSGAPVELAAGSGWSVEVLLPFYGAVLGAQGARRAANLASVVVRVKRGAHAVLIGGDATLASWERLTAPDLSADVIRVPHHGGEIRQDSNRWSRFEDLYDSVSATHAIVSVGTNNGHTLPRTDHLAAARRGGVCRLRCTQLTSRCHGKPTDRRSDTLGVAATFEPPYRHDRVKTEAPCAGTVLVSMDSAGNLTVGPSAALHDPLIDLLDHPLCR